MNPFDYTLCDRVVTRYRLEDGAVTRQVLENCYFAPETGQKADLTGYSRRKRFLLIVPGAADLLPGDRLWDGIGPQTPAWESLLPDFTPGVYEIGWVKPCCWAGECCHTQAKEAQ